MKPILNLMILFAIIGAASQNQVFAQTQSLDSVKASLISDIRIAQRKLEKSQAVIEEETLALSSELASLQQEVVELRQKNAAKRRLLDEQTLALSDIQSRLQQWKQQENYQKRLLLETLETQSVSVTEIATLASDINLLIPPFLTILDTAQTQLQPSWFERKIVNRDGQYQMAIVLSIGNTHWFVQPELQRAGLLSNDWQITWVFEQFHTEQLLSLFELNSGYLPWDPTAGSLLKIEQSQETVLAHLSRGGVWVLPILAFGLFAILIALGKVWQLWRLPKLHPLLSQRIEMLADSDEPMAALERLRMELHGAQQQLIDITLKCSKGDQRDDRLLAYLLEYRQWLQTRLGAIAITASVAPLLGLLGTVSGMIETFNMMNLFGSGDPAVVSGGISKALITTELGLIVAIPALILHALLSRYIKNYHTQLDTTAIRLGKLGTQISETQQRQAA